VVKDFAHKNWWIRLLGRLQISREQRAYRRLGNIPGIPALIGRIDAHAIAIEQIDGGQLGFMPDLTKDGAAKLQQLRRAIDRMHGAGLLHLDLRARENVLLSSQGELFVIDFASAMWLRPGGLAHRCLFPRLKWVDESAYLKWKGILEAGPYTDEEQLFLRRCEFWRAFWIFNRKEREAGRSGKNEP
jgi:serine/threonine protein kinase